ncbi:hypothetical protein [Agromyces atrinae]|uniref:Uncharacterized protein n=1 Tax=Agromyces atrinae TaxID=592376 RepID=A0A4Q2MFI7_9MICO|nr:hypothetical protein [Agromyces atrinae]NYD67901.1 hypothetical protein [Agromyces atrinae]RXZ87930.1 hypothetical protein ESP50_01670 [Agromyces atrinae]
MHFALAAGVAGGEGVPLLLVLFLLAGLAELAWGILSLRAGRVILPRTTLAASAILPILAALAALTADDGVPVIPLLAASVFNVVIAASAALALRRDRSGATRREVGPGRAIAGLVLGGLIASGIATPALALTEAGGLAVPHGQLHGDVHSGH